MFFKELQNEYRAAELAVRETSPIDPVHLCARMSEVLWNNAVYVDETTTHRTSVQRHLKLRTNNKAPKSSPESGSCSMFLSFLRILSRMRKCLPQNHIILSELKGVIFI